MSTKKQNINQANQIEHLKTEDLIPYARNSRTHSETQVAQVASSIKEFGFTNPVLVDADNMLIAGHGRVMAAKKLGLDTVPAIRLGYLTDQQKRAYVIADNKLALNAGWDDEMLALELSELQDLDFDLSLTGFDDDELNSLFEDTAEEVQGQTDADAVPEPPKTPVSKQGDIWVLGNHRLMCGDSTSIDAVEKLMDGELADQLVTDPPYNVAYEGKTKEAMTIQNDSMDDGNFRQFLTDAYSAANAVLKPGGVFYIWHADSEGYNFRGAAFDIGCKIRQCLIWQKNSMVLGRQDYHWKHEPCLYGWKDGAGHFWNQDRKQTTILEFNRPVRSDMHPTMKPVDLIEYCVQNNTKLKERVLDLFGGSGPTLIACEKLNRKARLMELDEKYVDVIINRWQDFTGKQAVHEATGKTYQQLHNEQTQGPQADNFDSADAHPNN